ncbi:MAG: hypothetical protein JWO03_912 [Bacteroidetes bacterium]|nr:hypothetical protein [Bacteroidota bacterium]
MNFLTIINGDNIFKTENQAISIKTGWTKSKNYTVTLSKMGWYKHTILFGNKYGYNQFLTALNNAVKFGHSEKLTVDDLPF